MRNNWTYFKFVILNAIKKRSVWITWLLFLLTISSYLIIFPAIAKANPLQLWANTTMAVCQTMLGMNVALFTAVLGIHIFRDGLEEGTELIVISKPFSRLGIVLNKFLAFGCMCLMVNLSSIVLTLFTYFIPSMDHEFYWSLVSSMFIGNLISFGIFGSIAILLSLRFAKTGVIIVNMFIALIMIIFQIVSLVAFSTPLKSLASHGVSHASYITTSRDVTTGQYKEKNIVSFNTDEATQLTLDESEKNHAIDYSGMISYWKDEILKKDPTKILNVVDLGNQLALSYLSTNVNQYSYRQAKRNFAFSRFYNYELTSPASGEIINQNGQPTLNWLYGNSLILADDFESIYFVCPIQVAFPGISPSQITRMRGCGDKIPIGFIYQNGKKMSSQDVFFEADVWTKYAKPFNLICDNIFNYEYYEDLAQEEFRESYFQHKSAWSSTTQSLAKYYQLLWSCFTGHSSDHNTLIKISWKIMGITILI